MGALLARHPVAACFALTLAISWGGLLVIAGPGGIPGAAADVERWFPFALVLLLAGPPVAALLLSGPTGARMAVRALARRPGDWRLRAPWLAAAPLATPAAVAATQGALSLFSPAYLPAIVTADDPWGLLLAGVGVGLVGGLLEEIGWTGFAVPRLRRRHGVLATGLAVGVVWAAWHVPVTVWASGDASGALSWGLLAPPLVFYLVVLPPYRVLIVWVHDRSASLPVVVLMHASLTASTLFVLPPGEAVLVPSYLLWAGVAWLTVAALVSNGEAANRARSGGDGDA